MKKLVLSTILVLLGVLTACTASTQTPPTITPSQTPTRPPTLAPTPTYDFKVQSDLIRGILQEEPEAGECLVYGVVRFSGQPIIDYTATLPQFWVRDENKGSVVDTEVVYDPLYGEYLYRFPAGTYGISADVVLGESYPTPGDYTSFTTVTVAEGQPTLNQDLALSRIIHLTSPFDNLEPWDIGFDRQKLWDTPLLESQTILFGWEAMPEAVAYYLTITEIELNPEKNLPWKNIQTHFDDRVTGTSLEVELPSSPEDHFYSAWIYAINDTGKYIGLVMIKLKSGGWGWDVRFRVP